MMPEHYEVKRISSYLKNAGLEGNKITRLEPFVGGEKILKQADIPQWQSWLTNRRILSIVTKAKYTFLQLDEGTLTWHYRFTGIPHVLGFDYGEKLYTIFNLPVDQAQERFCRFCLHFEDGKIMQYIDIRCLSDIRYFPKMQIQELDVYQKLASDLTHFSPEPFSLWNKRARLRKRNLKQELQDQFSAPSGIGNYLACEILAHAKLNPWLLVAKLSSIQYQALCQAMNEVKMLCERNADYTWFQVFNRKHCQACQTNVIRKKHHLGVSGQTTHYCPKCQGEIR